MDGGPAAVINSLTQASNGANLTYQLGTGFTSGWPAGNGAWYTFAGLIDEASVYSRALSAAEVLSIAQAGSYGKCDPVASVSPGTLAFPSVTDGQNATLTSQVSNPGNAPLSITSLALDASDTNFTVLTGQAGDCAVGTPLAAGSSCNIRVQFAPPAVASFTGQVTLTDNSVLGAGIQTIAFTGSGGLIPQTITFNSIPAQAPGGTITLTAAASSGQPVTYTSNTLTVCTVSGSSASLLTGGTCSITASQGGGGNYAPSTPVTQTFAVSNQTVNYAGLDTSTQGTWSGAYGGDGYLIATEPAALPPYATVSVNGARLYTWAASSSDPRATQTAPGAATRIASTYYATGSFTFNLNLTDGNLHRLALYLIDWDSTARAETITISDAVTNAVLDTESYAGFHNGVYAVWNIKGNVTIQVTKTGGNNAVVSGLFFGAVPAASSASYGGADTATQGTWTGAYGADGNVIANEPAAAPAYAEVNVSGAKQYIWAASTSDPRALQTASEAATQIASTFYSSSSFTINVNLTDGNTHRIALYLLDWDSTTRAETITIRDALSNAVLDTETYSGFHNGTYAVWNIKGNVTIQVTKTGGNNAVVSGIFFDSLTTPATASYTGLDITTKGTWTGVYGADGNFIATEASAAPAYAQVGVTADRLYTWSSTTSDPRALQTAASASTRIASTYYATGSFTINLDLTDGNTHQVSLYLLDWDSTSRAETVTIRDAASNAVLDTETYSSFHNGGYAVWILKGHVTIQVTKTAGANAVVSGVFFN